MKKNLFLPCLIAGLSMMLYSSELPATAAGGAGKTRTVTFAPDTVRVLDNPLSGWVMYLGRDWDRSQIYGITSEEEVYVYSFQILRAGCLAGKGSEG